MALITTPTTQAPVPSFSSLATGMSYQGTMPQILAFTVVSLADLLNTAQQTVVEPHWS